RTAVPQRGYRSTRRAAPRLAQRGVAAGAAEQHRADRPRDCGGADDGGGPRAVRTSGAGDYVATAAHSTGRADRCEPLLRPATTSTNWPIGASSAGRATGA